MKGWYSVGQSRICGVLIYRTPTGEKIEITCVSDDMDHRTKWDDISYVGEVCAYVGRKSDGMISDITECTPKNIKKLRRIIDELEFNVSQHRWN